MKTTTLYALPRPTAHAMKWLPVTLGAALGLVTVLLPEALTTKPATDQLTSLIRIAATCVALGAAFLLDDPAAPSTRTVPVSRLTRNLVRVAVAAPALAVWWTALLVLTPAMARRPPAPHLPGAALTLEAATLAAAGLALAAVAQVFTRDGNAGIVAAPAVLVLAAVTWFLPRPVALVLAPSDPHWTASHHRWTAVLAAAAITFVLAGLDRPTRRRPPSRPVAPGAASNDTAHPAPAAHHR